MRLKPNDICIVDINNDLNLKDYQVCKVRIVKKVGWGKYEVIPIEPVVYPISKNSYARKKFVIHKNWLTKTSNDQVTVIRNPIGFPVITSRDIQVLEALKTHFETPGTYQYASDLEKLIIKLKYYRGMTNIVEENNGE